MAGGRLAIAAAPRLPLYALTFAVIAVIFAVRLTQTAHLFGDLWLNDYRLYMQATQRWLAGGDFYPASQLGGPWVLEWQSILYPPVMLAWFVPFAVMPDGLNTALWLVVPPAVTAMMLVYWRPSAWGWLAIFAILALDPGTLANYTAGTPTTWYVALAALSTRWRWVSAFILTKPTLLPFALVGALTENPCSPNRFSVRNQLPGRQRPDEATEHPANEVRTGRALPADGAGRPRPTLHRGSHVRPRVDMAVLAHRLTLDPRWWAVTIMLAGVSLAFLPMTLAWAWMTLAAAGPMSGPLYSLGNFPLMLLPWVAWWARSRTPTPPR